MSRVGCLEFWLFWSGFLRYGRVRRLFRLDVGGGKVLCISDSFFFGRLLVVLVG